MGIGRRNIQYRFPVVEVYLVLVTTPLTDNVGHAGGFPLALEGTYTTGTEGFPPAIESMG